MTADATENPSPSCAGSDPSLSGRREGHCTARNRRGEPCRAWAVRGATVCVAHGGAAPQVRAAAARRLQRERLNGDLGRLLEELEIDAADRNPVELLLGAVHRAWAMVQVLGALVGGLGSGDLHGPNHLGDGAPHVLTEMYATWLDRAARASKLAVDAGIEERMVRITEHQAEQMAEILRLFARELGFDPTAPDVRHAARRSIELVRGGVTA